MKERHLLPAVRKQRRRVLTVTVITLLILMVAVYSISSGYLHIPFANMIRVFIGEGTPKDQLILFQFRLPRIIAAILVGAGLAVSGAILQAISRNGLADPSILGINSGAGLMVVLYVSFFPTTVEAPAMFLPILGFAGGLLAAAIVYGLSYKRYEGLQPGRLLLTGVAVSAGITALMTVLTLRLNDNNYQFIAEWLSGNMWGANWPYIVSLLPWLVGLGGYVLYKSRTLDILTTGDSQATGLGLRVEKEKVVLLMAAVGLAASCVSISGSIAFVGLMAPHMARRLVGTNHKWVLSTSAALGALLVVLADTIGRLILQPSEIQAGIVVAIIGAPYLLYLLTRSK